jgi:putative ABC transport system permease protein
MLGVTLAQVRAHAGRYVASALAVVIAVAFVVATMVLASTTEKSISGSLAAQYQGSDAVVEAPEGLDSAQVDALRELPGVAAVAADLSAPARVSVPGRGVEHAEVAALAEAGPLRWQQLRDGAWPQRSDQVAAGSNSDIPVGTELLVAPAGGGEPRAVTVTGVVDLEGTPQAMDGLTLYAPAGTVAELRGDAVAELRGDAVAHAVRIAGDGTVPAERLVQEARAHAPGATVQTGAQAAAAEGRQYFGSAFSLSTVLLAFAAIAVLVAGLVIANTFAVLVAARTKDLALLRSVGATSTQVRRSIRLEALAVGAVSSALGVLAGIGTAAGLRAAAAAYDIPIPMSQLSVPWTAVASGAVVGVLVTMLAATAPARAATRVSPLVAARPVEAVPETRRTSALRYAIGMLLLIMGAAGLAVGALLPNVLVGCAGGMLFFLGVVALAQRIIPAAIGRVGGILAWLGGPVAELAARNAGRNPRRTAATAMALLIGIALTSTIVVGGSLSRQVASDELDERMPVDFSISSAAAVLPDDLAGKLSAVGGDVGEPARRAGRGRRAVRGRRRGPGHRGPGRQDWRCRPAARHPCGPGGRSARVRAAGRRYGGPRRGTRGTRFHGRRDGPRPADDDRGQRRGTRREHGMGAGSGRCRRPSAARAAAGGRCGGGGRGPGR